MMKLHWSPRSPFVRKVMIFAHEVGLAERIAPVRTMVAMTHPHEELMRDNPLSKIPTLIADDGTALYDSSVICEYLDSLHPGRKLYPDSGPPRWEALRWQALGNGMLDALVLWRNERLRPPGQFSSELSRAFEVKTGACMSALEEEAARLEHKPLGIGHIVLACALGYLDFRFADMDWRNRHPRIAGWFASFQPRPSFQATMPADE